MSKQKLHQKVKLKLKLNQEGLFMLTSLNLKSIKGRDQSCKLNQASNLVLTNNKDGEIQSNNQDNHYDKGKHQCIHEDMV